MKFRLVSDIHLEMERWKHARPIGEHFHLPPLPDDHETILLLPGDIAYLDTPYMLLPFLVKMKERFKEVVFVPGNHEFYGGSLSHSVEKARPAVEMTRTLLLDNQTCVIDNVLFIGSTMWTDYGNNHMVMFDARTMINDYRQIRTGGDGYQHKITPNDLLARHNESRAWLAEQIEEGHKGDYDGVVVLTHHAPCSMSIATRFAGDSLNGCYFSDLTHMMDFGPTLWVHGHMHSTSDYEIYDTRVVCNPRGYEPHGEDTEYDPLLVIDMF